jgi:hypothetical protein
MGLTSVGPFFSAGFLLPELGEHSFGQSAVWEGHGFSRADKY